MPDSGTKPDIVPQRLCNEIQLFDLCDLASCRFKSGRYCTETVLLASFEKIAEKEQRAPERTISEDSDDEDVDDSVDGYDEDNEFAMENIDEDGDDGWEDNE